ncbi:Predicted arabinose efflux permease, MFS family [Granulicella rosea]|uniref:Predicted arabinose efflux permease, MFS family n=1 Tax=Granulicella rosea TaxID=474952 RepID=A0A239LK48_9BACT|nr:MFS transporter [Granulicella rosea]SNT30680.1 Predicted arabinose efflux permease, MFS family [Granulicella rosea]
MSSTQETDAQIPAAVLGATVPPEPMSMGAVLRVDAMRRLWYAQIVSTFGDFLALFAVINVLTFKLHGTPQQITGVQIAYTAPIAVLGILAGVFIDRWSLKPTLVASDFLRALLVLLLLYANNVWAFYAILAAISVVSSFFGPAQGVAIRSIIPMHGLRSANGLMQQVMFGMRIVGPALAAVIVANLGPKYCYWVDAASFIASGSLIASLALSRPAPAPGDAPKKPLGIGSVLDDMRQGMSFIFHHAGLLFVILALAAGMFVLGCFGPLIAVYVRDALHASTKVYGAASAMIGLGMLGGVNVLNSVGKNLKNSVLVYAGLGGIAVGLCLLTAFATIPTTVLGNLIIGFSVSGIVIPSNTMIQQETPAALMGRVGSTVMSLIFSAQIAGLILSGLLANHMGVRQVFAVCAVMLFVLMAAGKMFMEPKEPAAAA